MKTVMIAVEEVMGDTSDENDVFTGVIALVVCITCR
jgi:hypothetical protein